MIFEKTKVTLTSIVGRVFILFLSTFIALFTAGVIYGWSSLVLIFQQEHVYNELCGNETRTDGTCNDQELRYNLLYTLAVVAVPLFQLPSGIFLDKVGPRIIMTFGSFLLILGCLLVGFSESSSAFDAYMPGFILIGLSGGVIFVSIIPLCALFRSQKDTVLSVYNMAFDASSGILFFYLLINKTYQISTSTFFKFYALLGVPGILLSIFWPVLPKEEIDDEAPLLEKKENQGKEKEKTSIWPLLKSRDFLLYVVYKNLTILWVNMYFGTIEERLVNITDYDNAAFLTTLFGGILPASFVISPLIGYIINRWGYKVAIALNHFIGLVWCMLIIVEIPNLQILSFCLFSIFRGFYYSNTMVYCDTLFGKEHFGTGWGTLVTITGAVNLIQYFLLDVTLSTFNGNFLVVNYIQLGIWCFCTFFPIYTFTRFHNPPKIERV